MFDFLKNKQKKQLDSNEINEIEFYEKYIIDKTNMDKIFPFIFSKNKDDFKKKYVKSHLILSDIIKLSFKEKNSNYEYETTFNQEFFLRFTLATMFLSYFTENDKIFKEIVSFSEKFPEMKLIIYSEVVLENLNSGECSVEYIYCFYDSQGNLRYRSEFKTNLILNMDKFKTNAFSIYQGFQDVDNDQLYKYYNFIFQWSRYRVIDKRPRDMRVEAMLNFWIIKCLALSYIENNIEDADLSDVLEIKFKVDGELTLNSNLSVYLFENYELSKINNSFSNKIIKNHNLLPTKKIGSSEFVYNTI
ncbi:MAG: hypothetical protein ACRC5T_02825 [Cetobacterium sp.]